MDISQFAKQFPHKLKQLQEFANGEGIKDILGVEAVNHYKASFDNEGFTDKQLNPWKDVKRRDPNSPWYGHSGQTGKFSEPRTTAKILNGETMELRNAIRYVRTERGVRVLNEKPYAAVHQYGLQAYVYGRTPFKMPARPFMGTSAVLMSNIKDKIKREMIRIIKE